jgi:phage gp46-like protein
MVPNGAASTVAVSASVEGLNRLRIYVTIEAAGETSDFAFYENWSAAK